MLYLVDTITDGSMLYNPYSDSDMDLATWYFWRIDTVVGPGPVWRFATQIPGDINQDGDIDNSNQPSPNNELILMKLHGFTVGSPGGQEAFAWAFIDGWHYIQLSLAGSGTVNYELYVNVPDKKTPSTSNQNPAYATPLTGGSKLAPSGPSS